MASEPNAGGVAPEPNAGGVAPDPKPKAGCAPPEPKLNRAGPGMLLLALPAGCDAPKLRRGALLVVVLDAAPKLNLGSVVG